ncbi:MAG: PAS domain-containing protein [Deltaproteobacteria bacterium]|nr:PAS domain-containing protein [Deltaproteobacteria bacterium]
MYFPLVLDVVSQGIFTVDSNGIITSYNRAAQEITGYTEPEVLGCSCAEIFRTNLCDTICPLKQSIRSGKRITGQEVYIETKDKKTIPISISTAPLCTDQGELLGGVEVFKDMSQVEDLRKRLDMRFCFENMVSKNPKLKQIFDLVPLLAESDSTILVTGASGTGKEVIARAIHNKGPRRNHSFVPVNCAAMPDTLLESELFGYVKGAFTDAKRDREGRIAQASGGTLFLDEVGDIPRPVQVKLLRFLQDRIYEPLGSNRSIRADVRVIAATNRDIKALVEQGQFREDLYYRLNVMQIDLPPLCERMEDVPLLVRFFIDRFRKLSGKHIRKMSDRAISLLVHYNFPGNVRELENIIERAFILCQCDTIDIDCLPPHIMESSRRNARAFHALDPLEELERDAMAKALERNNGNRTRAAKELGIHRTTLVRKIAKYGIKA